MVSAKSKTCAAVAAALGLMVAPAGAAAAQVSPQVARRAIHADRLDFPQAPTVNWCHVHRPWGTLCKTSVRGCYVDKAFGRAMIVTHNLVWVSRNRRGVVSVSSVGNPPADIYVPGAC